MCSFKGDQSWWGGRLACMADSLINHVNTSVGHEPQTLGDEFQQPDLLGSCVLIITMNLLLTQELFKLDLRIDC
jgi:hypothetical protein